MDMPFAAAVRASNDDGKKRLSIRVWVILWLVAFSTRIFAAFFLPNAEQDGYSDAEAIARLSASLAMGHLHASDLYGFWLPLFQLAAAVVNVWVGHPLLLGKILAALCGAISCVLVFAITMQLTRSVVFAWTAFVLIVLNPLHILYSAACMTDVPFGFLVLCSLWFVLQDGWIGAAIFAALAGCVRVEAWALIPLLPLLQWFRQRRISPVALALLLLPPLGWLAISWFARGDPFAFFAERARYHAHYLDFHPSRRGFALSDISLDVDYLLLGLNKIVFVASLFAGAILIFQAIRRSNRFSWAAAATASYMFAIVGFLLLAYVTKRQPVWLPRYGLFGFVLGLPLMAWLLQWLVENSRPVWLGRFAVGAVILLCTGQMQRQIPIIPKVLNDFAAHRHAASALVVAFAESADPNARCFSDDVAVRVLSGLPADRFVSSTTAPTGLWDNASRFESYLREKRVAFLIFMPTEDSLPVELYPQLEQNGQATIGRFEVITFASSRFGPGVWLYRVRD